MLYQIIRRVRRPLLPPEELPKPIAPIPSAPAKAEEEVPLVEANAPATQIEATNAVQKEPAAVEPVVSGELALAVVPVPAEAVTEKTIKPTPTRHARKAKTEKE